jgi:tetratricopeptide (TPR) repeat protein
VAKARWSFRTLSGLFLASLVCVSAAAPSKPTAEDIARWLRELGDNDFTAREKASRNLWAAGEVAEAALREAAASDDAEVKRRASDILEKFKWGIYPDTPKDVLNLIISYQAANAAGEKVNLIGQLLKAGPFGRKALARIAAAEPDDHLRSEVFARISKDLPELISRGDLDTVGALVEAGVHSGAMGPAYYAAFWLLRGKLDERIAFFESLAKDKDEERQRKSNEVLAYLYRASGDLVAARRAAAKANRDDLVEALMFEAGDWKGLAALPEPNKTNPGIEKWGYRAAYLRLAGNAKGADEALAEVRKIAEMDPDKEIMAFFAAKIFFLNDRITEALDLLNRSDKPGPGVRFEVLCAQLRYTEAMEMVEAARKTSSKHLSNLERLQARTLYFLGEKDKALAIFARQAADIKEGIDPERFEDLVDAEQRVGLEKQALEHCAQLLGLVKENEPLKVRGLLAKAFPNQSDTAVVWWMVLRQANPTQPRTQTILRLSDLLAGKLPAKEVEDLVTKAQLGVPALSPTEKVNLPVALAEGASAVGLEDLARSVLQKSGSAPSLIRLGDLLAQKKEWDKAAERYLQAWEQGRSDPLPLFLAGRCLGRAGKKEEGKKFMEQSHWLPLGDEMVRDAFLHELLKRRLDSAAGREADLQKRVSRPESYFYGAALRQVALAAHNRKEYLPAAEAQEQSVLRCLKPGVSFVQPAAYAGVPAMIHRLRAEGLLASGQTEQARKEIALARAGLPGNIDLAIRVVPELEKRGLMKDADHVFAETVAVYEKACKEYPRCPYLHNSIAWVSACCRRQLDSALEHARKAIDLAPKTAGYLDTLAEVHFQRGENKQAVAAQKKVIELDPKKPYYRNQLRRLEAGDPKAPRPDDEDE